MCDRGLRAHLGSAAPAGSLEQLSYRSADQPTAIPKGRQVRNLTDAACRDEYPERGCRELTCCLRLLYEVQQKQHIDAGGSMFGVQRFGDRARCDRPLKALEKVNETTPALHATQRRRCCVTNVVLPQYQRRRGA